MREDLSNLNKLGLEQEEALEKQRIITLQPEFFAD